jgi:RNA polymerase sigma factor (sigma-70 family)
MNEVACIPGARQTNQPASRFKCPERPISLARRVCEDCGSEEYPCEGIETRVAELAVRLAGCPRICDHSHWPDARLVAAVREDKPDPKALNVLAIRFGRELLRRCMRLTGNWHKASDLAQETWYRLLRGRQALRPDGNFRAYLITVATNIWRDEYRAARRAGAMADFRLVSLDAGVGDSLSPMESPAAPGSGQRVALAESVPDSSDVENRAQRLVVEELHHVLACLSPLHREVLQARFFRGESCAMIGRRYGRTEQSISGWVREALAQARGHLVAVGRRQSEDDKSPSQTLARRKGPVAPCNLSRLPTSGLAASAEMPR